MDIPVHMPMEKDTCNYPWNKYAYSTEYRSGLFMPPVLLWYGDKVIMKSKPSYQGDKDKR